MKGRTWATPSGMTSLTAACWTPWPNRRPGPLTRKGREENRGGFLGRQMVIFYLLCNASDIAENVDISYVRGVLEKLLWRYMLVYVLVRVRLSTPPSHWTRWFTPTALTPPPVIPWATTPAKMKGRTWATPPVTTSLTAAGWTPCPGRRPWTSSRLDK